MSARGRPRQLRHVNGMSLAAAGYFSGIATFAAGEVTIGR